MENLKESPSDVAGASMHPIVLLPCPFCGADNWTQQTSHSTVQILTHRQGCWIGRSEQRQETWINPGSEFSALWNKRADYEDAEMYRSFARGFVEAHKASLGKDCGVWDSRNVGQ